LLRIDQALQHLEAHELLVLATNLRLLAEPPKNPSEPLVELLTSYLRAGVQWDRTGDSMPSEAHSLLLALTIWASAIAPQSEGLLHVASILHQQQHGAKVKRDRLYSLLLDLRNLGLVSWIPWTRRLKEQRPTFATDVDTGPATIYQLAFYERTWSQDGWAICFEVAASLFRHYAPHLAETIIVNAEPAAIRSDGLSVLYDVMQLMHTCEVPGLRLTQKAVLYKRDQARLNQRLLIQDPLRAHLQARQTPDDTTPLHIQWLLTWSYHSRLIQVDKGSLRPGPQTQQWLDLDPVQQMANGLQLWLNLVAQCKPGIMLVMAALLWAPSNSWVNLSNVMRQLSAWQRGTAREARLFFSHYAQGLEEMGSALAPLVYMGLMDIGSEEGNADDTPAVALLSLGDPRAGHVCLARLTPAGRQLLQGQAATLPLLPDKTPPFVVQSNFEVLVQPLAAPRKHWFLSQIAELTRADHACIYTITRQSVLRGLRAGWTGDQILAFLSTGDETATAVGSELPQNVAFSIGDWSSGHGRCTVMRIAVVQCESAALADRILAEGLLGNMAIGRVGPTALLVRDDALERVISLLEKAGLPPPERPVYVTDSSRASQYGMGLSPTPSPREPTPKQQRQQPGPLSQPS
jgi:hypothetical protein